MFKKALFCLLILLFLPGAGQAATLVCRGQAVRAVDDFSKSLDYEVTVVTDQEVDLKLGLFAPRGNKLQTLAKGVAVGTITIEDREHQLVITKRLFDENWTLNGFVLDRGNLTTIRIDGWEDMDFFLWDDFARVLVRGNCTKR